MLRKMCQIPTCKNAEVRNLHGCVSPSTGTKYPYASTHPGLTIWPRYTTTHAAISPYVMTGLPPRTFAPATVRVGRVLAVAARAQSTQWIPTLAVRWHCGHVGRPHRWHET
ncbi:MAG: hypothetical protein Q4G64_08320 [bacterium]|nr:hypothetical protein [bacterium]